MRFFSGLLIGFQFISVVTGAEDIRSELVIMDRLWISDMASYNLREGQKIQKFFLLGNKPGYRYELNLDYTGIDAHQTKSVQGKIACDSTVQIYEGPFPKSGRMVNFTFYVDSSEVNYTSSNEKKSPKTVRFVFDEKVRSCEVHFTTISADNKVFLGGLKLIQEEVQFPFLKSLSKETQDCKYNLNSQRFNQNEVFFTNDFRNMTCAQEVAEIKTLESSFAGFRGKIEILLGKHVSDEFIRKADPEAELDFSKAPKLKAIFVASLVFRSDFYGSMMMRLLKYHAERGTLVYVIMTSYMQSNEDHSRLRTLASENGNFRLQEYKYLEEATVDVFGKVIRSLRDMHIKMFVTLANESKNNVVITGGRNIHDGFLFDEKPNYLVSPLIASYAEEHFVHWNDFEIQVTSPQVAQTMFAHLLTYWNRDTLTQEVNFVDQKVKLQSIPSIAANGTLIRHVISIPFNDDNALEKLFVQMIDSAKHSIKLSSPYLRPTLAISKAIERAAARNIDIKIQTRINLAGDTQSWLYEQMNIESINKLFSIVSVYEWNQPSILHSKFLLIDGAFGFIGSVNVSRRSFIHDIESGFMIYSPSFIGYMENTVFQSYNNKSNLITSNQPSRFLPSFILKLFEDEF